MENIHNTQKSYDAFVNLFQKEYSDIGDMSEKKQKHLEKDANKSEFFSKSVDMDL